MAAEGPGEPERAGATPHAIRLTAREREAVALATEVRGLLCTWMARRGLAAPLGVSPYVDRAGRPCVLIRMDARLALAVLRTLPDGRPPPRRPNGTFRHGP
ncbi:hypothetical protein [Thermomonospora catenispora]|uniref:hypothetical protein n=1 Tax=Thermomonospora catenispora TaxID=2493090 RepID=UPI00111E9A1D|nr:hypothetical protein [Thermomonospora catenispora]TNY36553.1 hypothetical protein EIO00_12210 [Thermomonospora catenispora]